MFAQWFMLEWVWERGMRMRGLIVVGVMEMVVDGAESIVVGCDGDGYEWWCW